MTKSRLTTALLIGAAAFPANALPNGGSYQDLRSPDARDAAIEAQQAQHNYEHLRGLEARRQEPGYVDHRSPDAQDSGFAGSAEPPKIGESRGFDWGDAGIGATAMLGLLAIGSGAFMVLGGRRRRRSYRTATS